MRVRTVSWLVLAALVACGGSNGGGDVTAGAEKAAAPKPPMQGGSPVVVLETSKGEIEIQLEAEKAPVSVENFLAYVDAGFYDDTIFHRVIPDFMVQCGGFTAEMERKETRGPIENEADNGLANERGTLAMARTSEPNSATSQFFINLKANDFLNHGSRDFGYAVFGKVVSGMDVVDEIAGVATTRKGPHANVPEEPVLIRRARRKDG